MKTAGGPSPAWQFLLAFLVALFLASAFCIKQQYSNRAETYASNTAAWFRAGAAITSSSRAQQGASGLPGQWQGVPFNVTLGCWHVRADLRGNHSFHVAGQVDFEPGPRWEEAKTAMRKTLASNPGVHYILVTGKLTVLDLAAEELPDVPHDIWFCPEPLYGTPIRLGNLYTGPKFAVSVDNWFTPWTWQCSFKNGTHSFVYVVQKQDIEELSGYNRSCHNAIKFGGAEGFLFDNVPEDAVDRMKYPRSYWGCENLSMYFLKKAGLTLVNMCPWYVPIHVHQGKAREDGSVSIKHTSFSVKTGLTLDPNSLCKQVGSSS